MEIKSNNQSENKEQKFIEKYGMWILFMGLIASIFIIKFLLDLFMK